MVVDWVVVWVGLFLVCAAADILLYLLVVQDGGVVWVPGLDRSFVHELENPSLEGYCDWGWQVDHVIRSGCEGIIKPTPTPSRGGGV